MIQIKAKPLVSIVIPTYNHAEFLRLAIQSIIEQTYDNWEIIIINNYSTDTTVELVEKFKEPRIRLINFNNNGVIATSRNIGIKKSRGEWIAFLDSDDIWYPSKLEKCMSIIGDDKNVTAVQWVDSAIEQGLDCVAVTDHNSPLGIKAIQEASQGKNLTVFPGVEITCDTSKIHLLVLFDPSKGEEEVKSLLSKCDIEHNIYGEQNATTTKSVFEVADIVRDKCDALIIPAHIDEFAGVNSLSNQNLEILLHSFGVCSFICGVPPNLYSFYWQV